MPVFDPDIPTLRQGAATGRKVLYIWDRAGIDFRQWFEWKQSGVYFLSREKENMKLEVVGTHPFDRADPINQGVTVRRVIYQDPETGIIYAYLELVPGPANPCQI